MRTIGSPGTYIDAITAASSTAAQYSSVLVPQPTLASKNTAVITPVASSLTIQGPPLTGLNQTITNPYSLNVQNGSSRFSGPLMLAQTSTSRYVSLISASAMAANYALTLPTALPTTTGQALISDTVGNLSWGSAAATQSTFNGANNVTTPTNVTGLTITSSPTIIPIYVSVNATNSLFGIITIQVYYNTTTSTYYLDSDTIGDNTLVRFDVTATGQIVYNSANYAGFTSLTFLWFAPYTPVASVTSSLSLTSSLNVGTSSNFATTTISGSPSSTSGSLVFVQGNTFTDTSTASAGTAAAFNATLLGAPTLAASNTSVITTTASTLAIAGPPTAGTNETITNAFALNVLSGASNFAGPATFPGGIYANAITNQPVPQLRCMGTFNVVSGATTVTTIASYNILNIVRNVAGSFTVNFIKPVTGTYAVTTGFCRLGTNDFVNVFSPSSNGFGIELWSAGVTKDPINSPGIMFTIFS